MPARTISKGKHIYRIEPIGLAEGGYTFEIVHIDHTGDAIKEVRHEPGIAYATEEAAMDNGLHVAAEMAEQQDD
ncbi:MULTISPECIES: hypothetical protein [Paraburkholderia]|uniref:Uncharacterized protein n=1 Tax=Paraburkholderia podalyriae TaxID=1938811 RepID=A0ABR7PIN1_9BURK|nr:hypothetical protein [Paraburkholderia podalyriae]MBC8746233.1 hypothetical protein [Paraburkholderia podalyriae]